MMNREIKFRGLDTSGIWHYGYFRIEPDGTHFIRERVAQSHFADYEVIPETVGQFTGLKDKDGQEIYEGDIVEHTQGISTIRWINDGWRVGNWEPGYLGDFVCEVIDNIHENPELLKENNK